MPTHPLFWLAGLTFLILMAVLVWNLMSTKRAQKRGHHVDGLGGKKDPLG